jgi:pimeloyl-ACP methyl ester carboxylesterase
MVRLDDAFDRSGSVRRPAYGKLAAEPWSFMFYNPRPPDPAELPPGNGHVVLVVPAFLNNDGITQPLRKFLNRCGYRAFGWKLGINWGPTTYLLKALRRRLDECVRLEGGPVSVIGVSLGGLLARDLAHDRPEDVAHVITLVSPFRLPTASHLEPLFRLCAPFYIDAFDSDRLAAPLPMTSTAIFTRGDGLVAWQSCWVEEPGGAAFELSGAHCTICRNPHVMRLVGERLAGSRANGATPCASAGAHL